MAAWKYGLVPKMSNIAVGAQITATVYCPTCFFVLTLYRTGPGPYLLVSNSCLEGCLMELILGLIVTKLPCAGPFSGPPPLDCAGTLLIFATKESGCAGIFFRSMCAKSLTCITLLGFKKWLDVYWWRHQSSSKNGKRWHFSTALHPGLGIEISTFYTYVAQK